MSKTDTSKLADTSFTSSEKQDGGYAQSILNGNYGVFENKVNSTRSAKELGDTITNSDLYKLALHGSNLYDKGEIDIYNNIYRFGLFNPYNTVTNLREYLFFTKPDLNIFERDAQTGAFTYNAGGKIQSNVLSPGLKNLPFWNDLKDDRINTIKMLQNSYAPGWNMLLQNSVMNNLEIPALEGTVVDSPVNNYGVGFHYRGTSEASDDSIDFALEFKDTKWLDIYYFFKAYDDYQVLKHHGVVAPWQGYIVNRILHDQFSIYKFMVGDDMETIIYWCKLYGVMPINLPRDVFSSADLSNGLSYTINFKAAFFEEMRKEVLMDFNDLSNSFTSNTNNLYQYETYNSDVGMGDYRPAKYAFVEKYSNPDSPSGYVYKLKWKGDKKY